jgi:hypothetical protein
MNELLARITPRLIAAVGLGLLALVLVVGGAWFWLSTQSERAQALHAEALAQAYAGRGAQAPATARPAAMTALEAALARARRAARRAERVRARQPALRRRGVSRGTRGVRGRTHEGRQRDDPHARAGGHRGHVGERTELSERDHGVHRGAGRGEARTVLLRGSPDRTRAEPGARGQARRGDQDVPAAPEGCAEAAARERDPRPAGESGSQRLVRCTPIGCAVRPSRTRGVDARRRRA